MTCIPLMDRKAGEYPLEALPKGWVNAEVTLRHQNGKVERRFEILDLRSNSPLPVRYQQEPMRMIAFKCFMLFLVGLPLYFIIYSTIHLIRLPGVALVHGSPTAFFKQIWTLVRIPFYWIAMEFSALYGIFKPLEGRALFAECEASLHDGKTRRDSVQYKTNELSFWNITFFEKEHRKTFFAGFCMQPIGKTDESHLIQVEVLQNPQAV